MAFDPYHTWLGIPPQQQPPHLYRLLGLEPFESDADVIQSAADQRMAHVRAQQTGRHMADSQRILNELAAARICLLQPEKKANYDAGLRAMLSAASTAAAPADDSVPLPVAEPLPVASPVSLPVASPVPVTPQAPPPTEAPVAIHGAAPAMRSARRARRRSRFPLVMGVVAALALCGIAVGVFLRNEDSSKTTGSSAPHSPSSEADTRPGGSPSVEPQNAGAAGETVQPDVVTTPAIKPVSEPPGAVGAALRQVRQSMAIRDLSEAWRHLETARQAATTPTDAEAVLRTRSTLEALDVFWTAVGEQMGRLSEASTLQFGSEVMAVVEASRDELVIKRAGRLRNYSVANLPPDLAVALASMRLPAGESATQLAFGAFQAMDQYGDRASARRYWQRAGAAGERLLAEIPLAAAPLPPEHAELASPLLPRRDLAGFREEVIPAEPATEEPVAVERQAVPDAASLAGAQEEIKTALAADLAGARDATSRRRLVERLLELARDEANPARRFALLAMARDVGMETGDPNDFVPAIDDLARRFAVDDLALKAEAIWQAHRSTQGVPYREELVAIADDLVAEADEARNPEAMKWALRVAMIGARAAKDFRHLRELEEIEKRLKSMPRVAPGPSPEKVETP